MKRLIQSGLMFGNLLEVSSPVLIERYNRALEHLTGKRTELPDFHIDISGYSPEIGAELGDDAYLNHAGVNRQFILLTTEQKTAPLLNAKFSTSRDILRHFIKENEEQLFALTVRDAVAGELVNSVYDVSDPKRLLDIHKVIVEADTTKGTVAQATALRGLIDRFVNEDEAWYDDVLIAEMIGLAKKTGDIARNPVHLEQMEFAQPSFWTSHFDGLYIFRDVEHPAVISTKPFADPLLRYHFSFPDRHAIARFLELNGLAEPIVSSRGIDAAAILRQKMDFILVDAVAGLGASLAGAKRADLRTLARIHYATLPSEYHGLADLLRWADSGGDWPRIASDHPAYFYTLRASAGPHRDLVNMLLSELAPLDFRQMFICHKVAFYAAYAGWPDAKREFAVQFLLAEYQADKDAAREALFGHDAPLEIEEGPSSETMVARVGPWSRIGR
ncbi:MAG: DUF6638 family protein [Pseudomonadota bacterium]